MSWCDLDLTFDLAVVTLTYKIWAISETVSCRKLICLCFRHKMNSIIKIVLITLEMAVGLFTLLDSSCLLTPT